MGDNQPFVPLAQAASDNGVPLWLLVATALLALASLFWQWRTRPHPAPHLARMPRPPFWVGIGAWVTLGLLLRAPGACDGLPVVLCRLLPLAGMLATALLGWTSIEMPRYLRDEGAPVRGGPPSPADETPQERADLDPEDVRLLDQLMALLGRRAGDLAMPLAGVPAVAPAEPLEGVLASMRAAGARRLVVLDEARQRALGLIDARDLLPALYGTTPAAAPATAQEVCRALVEIPSAEPVRAALDRLRGSAGGVGAVIGERGRLIGFLSWTQVFAALVGRRGPVERL
jgi:CBS domain-containing protein